MIACFLRSNDVAKELIAELEQPVDWFRDLILYNAQVQQACRFVEQISEWDLVPKMS